MKMFVQPARVYLHVEAVDFRKSINGLVLIVEQQLLLSPFIDALFIFSNKKRDKLKILYWDKTGFALWYKRLEKHRFKWPQKVTDEPMTLSEQQLHWLLGGFDIVGHPPLQYQSVGL
ncbi:IS66 family insertion sequence element accessory protein TnpB [Aestuariibacter salexigens]|uniref:IS66 family insertion sequence element accessory protein TnpB n=1 Tax=Aestuariibacter salexigens TaxID=226010 RepID=UPI0003FF114B|nr:IS66 family insertion sequence element accessory protein TnpB [Aestuariibacter salexigens]